MGQKYLNCRLCGGALPKESIQGPEWPRQCSLCYPKESLPSRAHEAKEIAVIIDGRWFRVFPHLSNDGLLAMRHLKMMQSYVLLPDGSVRMRPDDFCMPMDIPKSLQDEIEASFIVTGRQEIEARGIFEAYNANDFEVID